MLKSYLGPLCAALVLSTALVAPAQAETLRIASQGDATSLDPHSHNEIFTNYFLANVYEGLVARDKSFEIAGQLAQSWEQVDATTWRFSLRKGVTFHDGSAFAADDVIFSMDRALSETSNFKHVLASVESYSAVDDMTVEIVTKAPNPILLNDLLDLMILDKQWAEANGAAEPINLQAEKKHSARQMPTARVRFRLCPAPKANGQHWPLLTVTGARQAI
ncbi:MAG: ABC transporter substrate-binding protein [Sulfitobacter sp.]